MLSLLFQIVLQFWQDCLVLFKIDEGGGRAFLAGSPCAPDPVHIVHEGGRCLEIDNVGYILNVNTASGHVGAD